MLSENTGFARDYSRQAYTGYRNSAELMFPVAETDNRLKNKELVIGVVMEGTSKAYPFRSLREILSPVTDEVAGTEIQVHYDHESESAFVTDSNGKHLTAVTMYWFAWYAFHPETVVFER